ncbi:DUF4352 domain-containing protein [Streptomonospora litoralis]|uniref:Telomeric repeat-binding factor 2 n=1 Tax=Streptomonospora litoralis TaxID=2498135 RepID=A0A4P6Q206_9ACTN|nr:DUF4352 domain-containing protein [Streptomonospora litoralis]QBI54638.1 Telomeric repeat-binding factor 2 [Streptomonospora litoralis]
MDEQRPAAPNDAAPRAEPTDAAEAEPAEPAESAEPASGTAQPPESETPVSGAASSAESSASGAPASAAATIESGPGGSADDAVSGGTQPIRKRRRWPKIAAAVGAATLIAGTGALLYAFGAAPATLGGLAARLPAAESRQQEKPPADGSWGRVGDPVSSGAFEFTVTGVRTGLERVGGAVQGERADGRFVMARVTVRNAGEEATLFTDADQRLVDTGGARHRPDNIAGLRAGNPDRLFSRLGPGERVRGGLIFDVPPGTEPAALRLKDFTSGDAPAVVRLEGWEPASSG